MALLKSKEKYSGFGTTKNKTSQKARNFLPNRKSIQSEVLQRAIEVARLFCE
ncbi:hypothetical protein [Algoriphagus hitonicola]|uniref:Uncharacterized protein n=1 Tax=Algoriphagus hitonicola TaxID=435880 RepID=A0A1I2VGQ4_9BACT|nr:hypothetical protein [Algoriphagus hitonicola]SFG86656.1 hypothetical protein SAMN04487988_109118 [Algoriphagus hitonicola]